MARSPLVTVGWLAKRLIDKEGPTVRVIDASWHMPTQQRDPHKEYLDEHLPTAQFLDIDRVADQNHPVPHMLPTGPVFAQAMERLGLSSDEHVVIYDTAGVAAAARTWWALRCFGHDHVTVLDGGLRAWKAATMPTESGPPHPVVQGHFTAHYRPALVASLPAVLSNALATSPAFQLADARAPRGRWEGTVAEPRPGLSNGHIPQSVSLPWTELVHQGGDGVTVLRGRDELVGVFARAGVALDAPLTASCGSGLTACVVALAAAVCGKWDTAVYDGSWTEWALSPDTPKVKA